MDTSKFGLFGLDRHVLSLFFILYNKGFFQLYSNVPNHLFENKLSISHKEKTNDKSNLIKYNPFKIKNLCFHPQKPLIYATNNKGYLLIWDLRTRKHMVSKQIFPFKICQMSFYKTGEYLAVILSNGESVLINSTTFLVVANIENQWLNKDQTSKYFKGCLCFSYRI